MRDQLISVIIAERPYRLTISSEKEEEVFRRSAMLVNDKLKEYAKNFAFRDKQDLLAMVSLQFAVECLRLENTAGKKNELSEKLKEVDSLLNRCLEEKGR